MTKEAAFLLVIQALFLCGGTAGERAERPVNPFATAQRAAERLLRNAENSLLDPSGLSRRGHGRFGRCRFFAVRRQGCRFRRSVVRFETGAFFVANVSKSFVGRRSGSPCFAVLCIAGTFKKCIPAFRFWFKSRSLTHLASVLFVPPSLGGEPFHFWRVQRHPN